MNSFSCTVRMALIGLLFGVVSVSGDDPEIWPRSGDAKYLGQAISEGDLECSVVGTFPMQVEWFKGAPDSDWDGSDPVPSDIYALSSISIAEPEFVEEAPMANVTLSQQVFLQPVRYWIRTTNENGTALASIDFTVSTYSNGQPAEGYPEFISWVDLADTYAPETPLIGAYTQPGLIFAEYGNWKLTVYRGDEGDESTPLATYLTNSRKSYGDFFVTRLRGFTLTESMRIWARLQSADTSIDIPAVDLVVEAAESPIAFVDWPATITDFFEGSVGDITANLNQSPSATIFEWYWGESGDTSTPMEAWNGAVSTLGENTVSVTVPSESRSFWVRALTSWEALDSPTAQLVPRSAEMPQILSEPRDVFRSDAYFSSFFLEMECTGGALSIQWYKGASGDTTQPISVLPYEFLGSYHQFLFAAGDSYDTVWARISNPVGSVDTRTVRVLSPSENSRQFLDAPEDVVIDELPFSEDGYVFAFGHRVSFVSISHELQRETDTGWDTVYTTAISLRESSEPEALYYISLPRDLYLSLAEGTYRLIAGNPLFDIASPEFTIRRADQSETPEPQPLRLLISPGFETSGGLYRSVVALSFAYQDFQVFAGELGDRSQPVTTKVNSQARYDPRFGGEAHLPELEITWIPNEEDSYWLEVTSKDGKTHSVIVKYPDFFALSTAVLNGLENYPIRLPAGVTEIPLPRLPDTATWYLANDTANPVSLPLTVGDLPAADATLTAVLENASPDAPPITVTVSVDETEPPRLTREPARLLADASGRILWAGTVGGAVERTQVFTRTGAGDFVDYALVDGFVGRGFQLPADADEVRLVWATGDLESTLELPVTRLLEPLTDALGIEAIVEGVIVSDPFGSFFSPWYYPWVFHHELGWWYLSPGSQGLYFYGLTAGDSASWNWTANGLFPYIYNFSTHSWRFYLSGSGGYFYDFTSRRWENVFE